MVPHNLKGAVFLPADNCVGAFLCGILQGAELFLSHIGRIELCAQGLLAVSVNEGLSVYAVPGAVVHVCTLFLCGILKAVEGGFRAEILLPVDCIGLICGKSVEVQDLLSIVCDAGKIRCGDCYQRIVFQQTGRLCASSPAGGDRDHSRYNSKRCNELSHKDGLCFI